MNSISCKQPLYSKYNCYEPNKQGREALYGEIHYEDEIIPTTSILCIRPRPDLITLPPKSIITRIENNPDGTKTATEYVYEGSVKKWMKAIQEAQKEGSAVLDVWS